MHRGEYWSRHTSSATLRRVAVIFYTSTRILEDADDSKNYWSWRGRYVGYRSSGSLFSREGKQIGYFAEGDEVYGCSGDYLGEVRGDNRLITNLSKKAWTRKSVIPRLSKNSSCPRDVNPKEMLAGFEDFAIPGTDLKNDKG